MTPAEKSLAYAVSEANNWLADYIRGGRFESLVLAAFWIGDAVKASRSLLPAPDDGDKTTFHQPV